MGSVRMGRTGRSPSRHRRLTQASPACFGFAAVLRCPHCGKHLGRERGNLCPYCGKPLTEKDDIDPAAR